MTHERLPDYVAGPHNQKLRRLRATSDIPLFSIKAGDIGGFVADGAYVHPDSWVDDCSTVAGNAKIGPHVLVTDASLVADHARVSGTEGAPSNIYGSMIDRSARVEASTITDSAISGDARITGYEITRSTIYGTAQASADPTSPSRHTVKNSTMGNSVQVRRAIVDSSTMLGSAQAYDCRVITSTLTGSAVVDGGAVNNCRIRDAKIHGRYMDEARISGRHVIHEREAYDECAGDSIDPDPKLIYSKDQAANY